MRLRPHRRGSRILGKHQKKLQQGTAEDESCWFPMPLPTAEEEAYTERSEFYKTCDWSREVNMPYAAIGTDDEVVCLLCGGRTEAHFHSNNHRKKNVMHGMGEEGFTCWAFPDIVTFEDWVAEQAEIADEKRAASAEAKQDPWKLLDSVEEPAKRRRGEYGVTVTDVF